MIDGLESSPLQGGEDVNAPIITLVEAKKEDIIGGLGQCAAQMSDRLLNIDKKEYYIGDVCKILGIFHWIISSSITGKSAL